MILIFDHNKLSKMYEIYLENFENEKDKYNLDYDEEPMTYDEFVDNYIGQYEDN